MIASAWLYALIAGLAPSPGVAGPPPGSASFLVLDLRGDGIYLSDRFYPVRFDIDGDGRPETLTWTARGGDDGFLWLDANRNGRVDDGTELRFELDSPAGRPSAEPSVLQGLAALDTTGGSGDGVLSAADPAWSRLRVWIDRDQDGRSSAGEVASLDAWNVTEIDLGFAPLDQMDGSLNRLRSVSNYRRTGPGASAGRPAISRSLFEVEFRLLGERP